VDRPAAAHPVSGNGTSGEPAIVEGLVEAVNERGIRVHGEWYNVSNFRPVALPEQGVLVRLEVRPNGFIKSVQVIKDVAETPAVSSDKDERIARLAVLKAAAMFAAERSDIKSADVLKIADAWLKWVNQ
jgi:hypothetical protein